METRRTSSTVYIVKQLSKETTQLRHNNEGLSYRSLHTGDTFISNCRIYCFCFISLSVSFNLFHVKHFCPKWDFRHRPWPWVSAAKKHTDFSITCTRASSGWHIFKWRGGFSWEILPHLNWIKPSNSSSFVTELDTAAAPLCAQRWINCQQQEEDTKRCLQGDASRL